MLNVTGARTGNTEQCNRRSSRSGVIAMCNPTHMDTVRWSLSYVAVVDGRFLRRDECVRKRNTIYRADLSESSFRLPDGHNGDTASITQHLRFNGPARDVTLESRASN